MGLAARGGLGGGVGLAGLAMVLVVLAPMSSAHGIVNFSAPYTGFTATPNSYSYAYGCGAQTTTNNGTWNATAGVFQFSAATHSGSCRGYNYGYSSSYLTVTSPAFATPFAGSGYVYTTFSSSLTAKAALHLGTSANSSGGATVYLIVSAYLLDVTHHSTLFVSYGSTYLVDTSFYGSSGSYLLSQGATAQYLYLTGNFTGGHLYQLEFFFDAYVYSETYGGGSTASASLDLGGMNGLTVSSISAY